MFSALLSFLSANVLLFILHIDGSSSFPKPLSAKEERAVLERLQDGDPAARATLIERNLRLVSHIVKKYYSRTNDTEDLVSIGTIGLIKAIDSFDPSKGTRLATYASRCIENEILMYFRAQRKTSGEVHLGDAIEIDKDGNPLTLQDVIRDERDMEQELEQKIRWEKVRRYIEAMPEGREREILVLRYGLDNQKPLTQREVAQRLNISRSYVSRIEKSVLTAIRRAVQPEENQQAGGIRVHTAAGGGAAGTHGQALRRRRRPGVVDHCVLQIIGQRLPGVHGSHNALMRRITRSINTPGQQHPIPGM